MAIGSILDVNMVIQELSLSGNKIDFESMEQIAAHLMHGKLQTLDLQNCCLDYQTVNVLFKNLSRSLRSLRISNNNLGIKIKKFSFSSN